MAQDHVTFLLTELEGSTRLLQDLGDRYTALVNAHHNTAQTACARHHIVRLELVHFRRPQEILPIHGIRPRVIVFA